MPKLVERLYKLYNEDCFETFKRIPDKSIDLVLCDPPYGTTQNKWDSIIPLDRLWNELNRVCSGAIAICCSQPFTSVLITSNLRQFKYLWTWNKVDRPTGHLNSKKQPMRIVEDIAIFYSNQCQYYPQFREGIPYSVTSGSSAKGTSSTNYGSQKKTITESDGQRYPTNLLSIKSEPGKKLHPTQKPVALMEYLIKTYTLRGDTVLDFATGSGTTGVACGNLGCKFIGCDNDKEHGYFEIAQKRIREAYSAAK